MSVNAVNDRPVEDNKTPSTNEDTAMDITLTGADVETCNLTFAIMAGPAHGALSGITDYSCVAGSPNTDSAKVTYTPGANYNGSDSFTYKVTDGGDGASGA